MQTIPLAAVPSQRFSLTLGGQAVQCAIYLLGAGIAAALYMDLISNGQTIFTARIVRAYSALLNNTPTFMTVGAHYLGFDGDLLFIDTQATPTSQAEDPIPDGLGTRWQLMYLSLADLEAAGLVPAGSA